MGLEESISEFSWYIWGFISRQNFLEEAFSELTVLYVENISNLYLFIFYTNVVFYQFTLSSVWGSGFYHFIIIFYIYIFLKCYVYYDVYF